MALRLANRNYNIKNRRKSKNKNHSTTGLSLDPDWQSSSEYLGTPEDYNHLDILSEEQDNSDQEDLTLESPELRIENEPNHSSDCIDMTSNIAPTAPILAARGSMGTISSKPSNSNAMYSHPRLGEYIERQKSSENNVTHHSHSGGTPNANIPTSASTNRLNNTDTQKRTTRKRSATVGPAEAGKKRSKFTPNVYDIRPRLIVVLPVKVPLTYEKGASTRTRTETTQQPRVQTPASELDEVETGPSAEIANPLVGTRGEKTRYQTYVPQSLPQHQSAFEASGAASNSYDDELPSITLAGLDSSHQAQQEQSPVTNDIEEPDSTIEFTSLPRPKGKLADLPTVAGPSTNPMPPAKSTSYTSQIGHGVPVIGAEQQTYFSKVHPSPTMAQDHTSRSQLVAGPAGMQNPIDKTNSTCKELLPETGNQEIQDVNQIRAQETRLLSRNIRIHVRGMQECELRLKCTTLQVGRIENGNQLFELFQHELGHVLAPDESFFRAAVHQVDGPELKHLRTGLWLRNGNQENEGWETMLRELETVYKNEGENVRIELEVHLSLTGRIL